MQPALHAHDRLIVALDVETTARARAVVEALGEATRVYKIGLQLLTASGPDLVRELVAAGKQVFLDLKLYEIPDSVTGAVSAAGALGVSMVTVHASGGSRILRAAVDAARPYRGLRVVALTVVTSLGDDDLAEVGIEATVGEQVARLTRLAEKAGCDGVVVSPREAALVRSVLRPDGLIVTPGIRLRGETPADDARTATPSEAILAGATHIVVGRSITGAADVRAAFENACAEIAVHATTPPWG